RASSAAAITGRLNGKGPALMRAAALAARRRAERAGVSRASTASAMARRPPYVRAIARAASRSRSTTRTWWPWRARSKTIARPIAPAPPSTATSGLRLLEVAMSSIRLKTELPGPRSRELFARREAAVPRGSYNAVPIFVKEASGALLEDVDGNRLLDFAGGIGCLNVGHADPGVVKAASEQLARFTHACFHVTPYESYVRLAERLNAL